MNRINVVSQSGEIESIPAEQLADAQKQGYRVADPKEVSAHFERQEYTSGIKPAAAGLAGAARALTFGGSDVALSKSGLVNPETLKKLEEYNPAESLGGEAAAIVGSLFVPGYGEATAASGVARAGARAAARVATAPVRAATELGQAVTKGVSTALPASSAVGRVASTATSLATGAAAESALYGLGRAVTEYGMGDPSLNGESIMSHVGLSALIGGGVGGVLGIGVGASAEAVAKYRKLFPGAPSPAQALDEIAPEFGIIGREMDLVNKKPEERAAFLASRAKEKKNIDEIQAAAIMMGDETGTAPLTEGMRSGSEHFQRIEQAIRNRGTPVGVGIQEQYNKGWEMVAKKMDEVLGPEVQESLATLGRKLKDGVAAGFEKRIGPITQLYDEIHAALPHIDIGVAKRKRMSVGIMKLVESEGLTPSMAQYKYIQGIADDIMNVDNLQKLQNWRSALGKEVSPENRYISGVIREKLNELEYKTIKGSLDLVPEPDRRAVISELIAKIDEAKPAYRKLREEMEKVGKNVLGRKKIYGPQDFLDAIEDGKSVETFAKSLLKKENSEFMGFMQREFKDEFQEIMRYHRQQIRERATREGLFNPKSAVKEIQNLEPEMRSMIFDQNQQSLTNAAEIYLNALPRNFNPSGTSAAEAYQRFVGVKGISDAVAAWASLGLDALQKTRLHSAAKRAEDVHALVGLESAALKSIRRIQTGARAIFSGKDRGIAFASSKLAESLISHEDPKKMIKKVREIANNPELMIERLGKGTEDISMIAPETTQSIQASAARAFQYLSMVAPETESPFPLGDAPEPSFSELNIFSERLNIIKNPTSILDEISFGSLTPEHVELVSTIYPKMYETMQQAVVDQMVDAVSKKKSIPYRTKNMLSLFLNQDLDDAITAQSILGNQMAIQKAHAEQAAQQQMAGGVRPTQTGMGKLDSSKQAMTAMQKSSQRIDT